MMNNPQPILSDDERRCVCCGIKVPIEDPRVPEVIADRIREIIKAGYSISAIKELRLATGLGLGEAKYWVNHCGTLPGRAVTTGPCPYCGKQMRTSEAKQCRHCLRDWHDLHEVKSLVDDLP